MGNDGELYMHQIIFTSCRRGIDGNSDGKQIYSYDKEFPRDVLSKMNQLFKYKTPDVSFMDDTLAEFMPESLTYKQIDNGYFAITLSTYLGRDYTGESSRFGNHISHSYVGLIAELEDNPIYLYYQRLFNKFLPADQVNSFTPPDYLPEIFSNDNHDHDQTIREFLLVEKNFNIVMKMLSLLAEKNREKSILICDRNSNIPQWIAALCYLLPGKVAAHITYSSYEYNPEMVDYLLCGVLREDTAFDINSPKIREQYHIFDIDRGDIPPAVICDELYEFMLFNLKFSPDEIDEFSAFTSEKTRYENIDNNLFNLYYTFSLIRNGIKELDSERIGNIFDFVDKYGKSGLLEDVITAFLNMTEEIPYAMERVILSNLLLHINNVGSLGQDEIDELKLFITNTFLDILLGEEDEDYFEIEYDRLSDELARQGLKVLSVIIEEETPKMMAEIVLEGCDSKVTATIRKFLYAIGSTIKSEQWGSKKRFDIPELEDFFCKMVEKIYEHPVENARRLILFILNNYDNKEMDAEIFSLLYKGIDTLNRLEEEKEWLLFKFYNKVDDYDQDEIENCLEILLFNGLIDIAARLSGQMMENQTSLEECKKILGNALSAREAVNQGEMVDFSYNLAVLQNYLNELIKKKDELEPDRYKQTLREYIEEAPSYCPFPTLKGIGTILDYIFDEVPVNKIKPKDLLFVRNTLQCISEPEGSQIPSKVILAYIKSIFEEVYSYEDALNIARSRGDNTTALETAYKNFMADMSLQNLFALRQLVSPYHPQTITKDHTVFAALTSPIAGIDDMRWYFMQLFNMNRFIELISPLEKYMNNFNALETGDNYQMPVFLISGTCDWICPVGLVKDYVESLTAPEVKLELLEGYGHTPQIQLPEEFTQIIKDFLKK